MMPTALVMCFADPSVSPRPRRMVQLLTEMGYQVDLLAYPTREQVNGRKLEVPRPADGAAATLRRRVRAVTHLVLRRLTGGAFRDSLNHQRLGIAGFEKALRGTRYDLMVVHDIHMLSLALRVRGRARLVVDAREFYPRQNDENLWFRIADKPEAERICRVHLPKADVVMTVSPGLVDAYEAQFGVRPHLIVSAPRLRDLAPSETVEGRFRLVHAGMANPNRQLEKMIDIVSALDDRFTLDFYLTGLPDYIETLRAKAARSSGGRVRILPPVAFDDIVPTLNRYDIGLYYLEPLAFNLRHSLPNKLFEFIQARLMVAIGPSPDMARVVREHDCGVVADSFDPAAMVRALSGLTAADVRRAKEASHAAARVLCFEEESKKLRQLLGTERAEAAVIA